MKVFTFYKNLKGGKSCLFFKVLFKFFLLVLLFFTCPSYVLAQSVSYEDYKEAYTRI